MAEFKMIGVLGLGHVGLPTAVGFAELGYQVIGTDSDARKVETIAQGKSPFYEPGLEPLLQKNLKAGRLRVTTDVGESVRASDILFVCVGTPQRPDGSADLSQVEAVIRTVAENLNGYKLIVEKSTVPVQTAQWIKRTLIRYAGSNATFDVASNPEFLREGTAIHDFFHPDRIVIGVESDRAKEWLLELYRPLNAPVVVTDLNTAEIIKHAANSFLALKISFINMVADLCEATGADVVKVAEGIGLDPRIGKHFLQAGVGFGGYCFDGAETSFTLNSPYLVARPMSELFQTAKQNPPRFVLSFDPILRRPTIVRLIALTCRDYEGEFVRIKTRMGRQVTVTADHPIVLYDKHTDAFKVVEARRVRPGDLMLAIAGVPHLATENSIDLPPRLIHSYKVRSTYCPSRFTIDEDFMRLIGYYIAEGCIVADKKRNGIVRERVNFTFGARETEYLNDLRRILNRYGIRYLERRSGNSVTIVVSSKVFAFMFRDVLKCGSRSEDKRLPQIAFNVSKRLRFALLQGLFSGDGSISSLNSGRNACLEYATVSKPLADGVILLLQSLGIVASLKTCRMKKSKQLTYIVRVNGLSQMERLISVFGRKKSEVLRKILARYQRSIRPNGYHNYGGFITLPVTSVERFYDRREVYSMETENGLLVAGSGLVVHNCLPKDLKAFIRIAEEHNVDFSLLKEVERINEARVDRFIRKVQKALWVLKDKTLAVWGLAFKPNTDDIREAPSLKIIHRLLDEGANLRLYDPAAMENVQQVFPENFSRLVYCRSAIEAATGAHAILLVTEWDEFKQIDWEQVKQVVALPIVVDGRNCLDPTKLQEAGFEYYGMGRPSIIPAQALTTYLK
jgi:UDP-glucose 6-dehydrogenase